MITSIDLTHNSRKAWKTIKSLSNDPTTPTPPCLVNANHFAHQLQLLVNERGNMPTKPKRPILATVEQNEQSLVYPFTEEEYRKEIAILKNNEAAGINDVLVEQLKHFGPRAYRWLHSMLTRSRAQVHARLEPQRLLCVIPSLNMQHHYGRDLITLTYWIRNSTLHAEQ